jgi:hypothetical protein
MEPWHVSWYTGFVAEETHNPHTEANDGRLDGQSISPAEEREFFELLALREGFQNWMVGLDGLLCPKAEKPEDQPSLDAMTQRFHELLVKMDLAGKLTSERNFDEPFAIPFTFYPDQSREAPLQSIAHCHPSKRRTVRRGGKEYIVYDVPRKDFHGFGVAFPGPEKPFACVREDLPPLAHEWLEEHELFHLRDRATWGGTFGMELRANLAATLRHPLGAVVAFLQALREGRIQKYVKRWLGWRR